MKTLRERLRDWAKMRLEVGNGMLPFVVLKGKADEAEKIAIYNQALEDVLPFISSECERARGEASEETLRKILVLMSKWQGASQAIYSGAVDEINQIFASLTHTKL